MQIRWKFARLSFLDSRRGNWEGEKASSALCFCNELDVHSMDQGCICIHGC